MCHAAACSQPATESCQPPCEAFREQKERCLERIVHGRIGAEHAAANAANQRPVAADKLGERRFIPRGGECGKKSEVSIAQGPRRRETAEVIDGMAKGWHGAPRFGVRSTQKHPRCRQWRPKILTRIAAFRRNDGDHENQEARTLQIDQGFDPPSKRSGTARVFANEDAMKSKLIHKANGQATYVLVFMTGDEVASGLKSFATDHGITAATFRPLVRSKTWNSATSIGQGRTTRKPRSRNKPKSCPLIGDISEKEDGGIEIHAHIVVGRSDTSTRGGHLLAAHVRPTLEVVLTESPHTCNAGTIPKAAWLSSDFDGAALLAISGGVWPISPSGNWPARIHIPRKDG